MTFICISTIILNRTTVLFIAMITNDKISIPYTTIDWTKFRIAFNSIIIFFSLHKARGFYSMRIFQSEDKRFIIIFIFIYRLLLYHIIIYTISTPRLSGITSKDPASTTLYDDQSGSLVITIVVEGLCCISMF